MNQTLTEKESAIKFLKEHYRDLLDKHRKYMNGDDDYALDSNELNTVLPLLIILRDLSK